MTKKYKLIPALCLDFDVIRRSKSGSASIKGPEDIELFPGVEEKLIEFTNDGYLLIGFKCTSEVAFGLKTAEQIKDETTATEKLFKKPLLHFGRFCFSDPRGSVEPWCHRSLFTNPFYGILAAAENVFFEDGIIIDWNKSILVGNTEEQEIMAATAGIGYAEASEFFNRIILLKP